MFLSSQDEDEDIFQSDDDLDDNAPLFIPQQPISMYATAGEITDEVCECSVTCTCCCIFYNIMREFECTCIYTLYVHVHRIVGSSLSMVLTMKIRCFDSRVFISKKEHKETVYLYSRIFRCV